MTFPFSNSGEQKNSDVVVDTKRRLSRGSVLGLWVGLGIIALLSFHAIGVLVFNCLGLSPNSKDWPLALALCAFLSIAGFFTSVQSFQSLRAFHKLFHAVSAASSGAVLGVFVGAELSGQDTVGSAVGLAVGGCLLFLLALVSYRSRVWFLRCFVGSAIALIGSLCAYAITFILSAWFWAAVTTQHFGLAVVLGVGTLVALWLVRRSLKTVSRYLFAPAIALVS